MFPSHGVWMLEKTYFTPNPHTCTQKLQGIGAKLTVWNKITFRDIRERKDSIIKDIAMV